VLRFIRLLSTALALAALGGFLWGQGRNTAGLYGRATDQQGAVVPGAKVILVHAATGLTRTAESNAAGEFEFPTIPVGEYKLEVRKQGFRTLEQTGIVLQVNDNRRVDVSLAIGEVSTTVNVQATAAAVDTSSATLKDTVDSHRVVDLPLNGRNLADLTSLVSGVQSATEASGADGAKASFAARYFSVNGSRQNTLKYTLDGGDNEDTLQNTGMPFPFPDAVQEFSVETSNPAAEFGRSSGGSVNIVTKSGTNSYHGDAFWFVRNTAFDANDFFSRSPDELKQNQGGVTFGGPIIKDRLFFFAGYQQTWIRQESGSGTALSVPAAFRSGDFSSLLSGPNPVVITDPATGQPYPQNQIPSSELSPAAQNLLKYAPLPDPDGFVHYSYPSQQSIKEWIGRGDYRLNDKNNFFVRLYRNRNDKLPEMLPNNIFSIQQGVAGTADTATVGETFTPLSDLVIDTHFTANRYGGDRTVNFPGNIRDLGVNISPSSNEINVVINGTSNINLLTATPAVFARENFELTHSWHWIKGRHSLVWGADIEDSRYNEYNTYTGSGQFQFNGRWTGFDQADFITGQMSSFLQGNGEIEFKRFHYFGFYGGDTFRPTPRLALTFGLRYEPYFPMTDLNDRIAQFQQQAYEMGFISQRYVNAPPGLLFPGDKTPSGSVIPRGGYNSQLNALTPRLGFAWDVFGDGKTSLRGGYGIYYDTPELFQLNNMNDQAPFSFTVQFLDGLLDNPYAGREQDNVFPYAGDFSKDSLFPLPDDAVVLQPNQPRPYTQNWNLTIERQLRQDWTLRLSYVGTKGTHLWADFDQNAPIYDFSQSLSYNQQNYDPRRPRQEYEYIDTLFAGLNQDYNSFQVSLNKRFRGGLSNQLGYTFSKNIDYMSSNYEATSNTISDPFDFFRFRGPADFDHRQRFVDSFVWQIPDAGRALGSAASAILGHWQAGGIITLQSGNPFSIYSTDDAVAGAGTANADVIGQVQLPTSRSRGARIAEYFNTSAVTQATPGTYGTLGRNALVGPGLANVDFSMSRAFRLRPLGEAGGLVFRAEFFNLFNRVNLDNPGDPNLANPGNLIGTDSFGMITATATTPRILQFSLKLTF